MSVYALQPHLPASLRANPPTGGVWVLGFFDGLHRGHRQLFDRAKALAEEISRETKERTFVGCWTFDALPKAKVYLTSPAERAFLMAQMGVSYLSVNDFGEISHLSGLAFWEELLLRQLKPAAVVCGFNFRFGYLGECGAADLVRWGEEAGVRVVVEKPCHREGVPVSSTEIRVLVGAGEMEKAADMLTVPWFLTGTVEHGKALGRTLGFPTANLRLPSGKTVPPNGVYACIAVFTDDDGVVNRYPGVCNIGSRPTVSADWSDITVEPWLLGYSGNLYERSLTVYLCKRIRGERKFGSVDALATQVRSDGEAVLAWFRENPVDAEKLWPGPVEKSVEMMFSTRSKERGGVIHGNLA